MKKRMLAGILALVMLIGLLPVTALADGAAAKEQIYWAVVDTDTDNTPDKLVISSAEYTLAAGETLVNEADRGSFDYDQKSYKKNNPYERNWHWNHKMSLYKSGIKTAVVLANAEDGKKVAPVYTSYWFKDLNNLTAVDLSGLSGENLTDMSDMFTKCIALKSVDLTGLDTSKVTRMMGMFTQCKALTSLDLSTLDTSNVEDMSYMFTYCENIHSLDLSNFSTSKVTNVASMFNNCTSLDWVNLSGFDVSGITSTWNKKTMFSGCTTLRAIAVDEKTNLDGVSIATETMTLWLNGGKLREDCTIEPTLPLPDPYKPGYGFLGWYTENGTTSEAWGTKLDGAPASGATYYARWGYAVTFDSKGGSEVKQEAIKKGEKAVKPEDPTKDGCTFVGWYKDESFTEQYDFNAPVTESLTLYAKWEEVTDPAFLLPILNLSKPAPKLNTRDHFAYVQGYPDGTVRPAGSITRAEVAAILFRLMDADSRSLYYSTASGFRDVDSTKWYNTYVATLNNAGVITDSRTGYFRPNDAITRAELAAMLAQFAEKKSAAIYFSDVSAGYWAANAIALTANLGWINGYPDGTFGPDKTVTRAELMAMVNRATGRAPASTDALLSGMKTWKDNADTSLWYYLDVQEATNSHTYTGAPTETWTSLTTTPDWSQYE